MNFYHDILNIKSLDFQLESCYLSLKINCTSIPSFITYLKQILASCKGHDNVILNADLQDKTIFTSSSYFIHYRCVKWNYVIMNKFI